MTFNFGTPPQSPVPGDILQSALASLGRGPMGLDGIPGSPTGDMSEPPFPIPTGTDDFMLSQGYEDDPDISYERTDPIDRKNIRRLSDTRLERMGIFLMGKVEEARSALENGGRNKNIKLQRETFECVPPPPREDGSCAIVPPDARSQTETISARQLESLLAGPDYLSVQSPLEPEDDEATRKCVQFAMSQFGAGGPIHHATKLAKTLTNVNVDGMVIWHTMWKRKKGKIKRRVVVNNATLKKLGLETYAMPSPQTMVKIGRRRYRYGSTQLIEFDEVIADHFDYELIDFRNFFRWPASHYGDEPPVIEGYFYNETPDQMRSKAIEGIYDKKAVKKILGDIVEFDSPTGEGQPASHLEGMYQDPNEDDDSRYGDGVERTYEMSDRMYARRRLACLYAKVLDADGDGKYDDVCFCIDTATNAILRAVLNEYDNGKRPFYGVGCDPRIGQSWYHYALIEKLMELQMEVTVQTRQLIDAGSQNLTKIIEQTPGRVQMGEQRLRQGINWREVGEYGEIQHIHEFQATSAESFANRDSTRKMIQIASGADESIQGVTVKGDTTLGQNQMAVAGGNIRLKYGLYFLLEAESWLFQQFFDYCAQFMEESRRFNIIVNGKKVPGEISLDDIAVSQYSTITGYSPVMDPNASLRVQMAKEAFTVFAKTPMVSESMEKMGQIVTDYARAIGVDYDLGPRIGTVQDWKEMQIKMDMQRQLAMQAQAAMGGQPGAPPTGEPPGGV